MTPLHRQEGVPPLAIAVRRILHEHLDVALAGSAAAWEVERLYHLTAAATPWFSWVGSSGPPTPRPWVSTARGLRLAAKQIAGYRGSEEDSAQKPELAEVSLGR